MVADLSKEHEFATLWKKYSCQDIEIVEIEGDHFSLVKGNQQVEVILEKLKAIIN